jgi:hypothetical protein
VLAFNHTSINFMKKSKVIKVQSNVTQVSTSPEADSALVKIVFKGPDERVWASPAGENRFRIANALVSRTDAVMGDIVEAIKTPNDRDPIVTRVVEKSGNVAIAIIAPFKAEGEYREFLGKLEALGCVYERGVGPLGVLTVTPQLDRSAIDQELSRPEVIQTKPGLHLAQLARMLSFAFAKH